MDTLFVQDYAISADTFIMCRIMQYQPLALLWSPLLSSDSTSRTIEDGSRWRFIRRGNSRICGTAGHCIEPTALFIVCR